MYVSYQIIDICGTAHHSMCFFFDFDAQMRTRHWSIAWSTTLCFCWIPNHVSNQSDAASKFKSDKLVPSFRFYKEYQTGRLCDILVCICVPKIIILWHIWYDTIQEFNVDSNDENWVFSFV